MKEAQERMGWGKSCKICLITLKWFTFVNSGLDVSQKKEGEGEMEGAEKSVEEEYNLDQYSSDENEEEGKQRCPLSLLREWVVCFR